MHMLKRIELKGYKSIKNINLDLRPLNVFIGANGSGKSNLVSFFKLLNAMMADKLQAFVASAGGANSLLHYGAQMTRKIEARFAFESGGSLITYRIPLGYAGGDKLVLQAEDFDIERSRGGTSSHWHGPRKETVLNWKLLVPKQAYFGRPDGWQKVGLLCACRLRLPALAA